MKKSLAAKNLITSIIITASLLYFMIKSPKIIFIPFLICSMSMVGKSIAAIFNKAKMEILFGKLYIGGFLLFLIGFLGFACYTSVRDKNYGMLIFSIPFWLVGIYLVKNKLLKKNYEKSEQSVFSFAFVISALLVTIALLSGIFLLVFGIREGNWGIIFGGAIFTFGSFTFVLAALTLKGCFDKVKIDVLGLYAGIVVAGIGIGFIALKYIETHSFSKTMETFGLWMIIPVLMAVAGVIKIVKCIYKK